MRCRPVSISGLAPTFAPKRPYFVSSLFIGLDKYPWSSDKGIDDGLRKRMKLQTSSLAGPELIYSPIAPHKLRA